MNIGFLGTGKMATAIVRGLVGKQAWPAEKILGYDISPVACESFTRATGVACSVRLADWVRRSDVIVLAVKPQQARAAAEAVRSPSSGQLVISIAAGLSLGKLAQWLGHDRLVRVMPNTPATIGHGVSVYAHAPGAGLSDREIVERIFGAVGLVRHLEEPLLDAVTALSGSGPAYVFELIQGLAEAGTAVGLEPGLALELTVQTVIGGATMVQQGIGSPEQLRDAVTSPGGTTEAGLRVLREGGFRQLLASTVRSACDRSVELGED